ncbi:hypothetical protein J7384_06295 [Endozoicomonas sp. G2_1]|uniref:hypothetical protein n=1 Tax=Endozoicomonas sp. G2_1 TaxID=2821091 RepID=UPI001ADBC757|nr:hypothetical protein [Endozoicomonas sp. G2_1]MBO9489967.1 hypothetical protein [Endozoicomonas sp. G2_1]
MLCKRLFIGLLLVTSVASCGGGSGSNTTVTAPNPNTGASAPSTNNSSAGNSGDNSSTGGNNSSGGSGSGGNTSPGNGQQGSGPVMKPNSSIALNRNLDVLILSSHASDQRALRKEELDASFELVKAVLTDNQIVNNYQVKYAQYQTAMSSTEMVNLFNQNNSESVYPESFALANSEWIKRQQNIDLLNSADIVVLRTSFNSTNTAGAFWGAATGETVLWPNLKKINGLNQKLVFLNSPIDPTSAGYAYQHNAYLADNLKITRFDRIFAHEFIHALGYGAHDNGVDIHQSESFSERIKKDLAYADTVGSTLSYGDCFSVMGNADCSLMLSPSARELLGVNLDFVPVYQTGKVSLSRNQLLKVLLTESTGQTGHEKILTYLTFEPPVTAKYSQSLNGDVELAGVSHSLKANSDGYLVRIVKVDISHETTPNVVLIDAAPPLNDVAYTLKATHSIEIGGKVKVEFVSQSNNAAEFMVTYP